MASPVLLILLLCAPTLSFAEHQRNSRHPPSPFTRRSNVPPEGYYDPKANGGSMLTSVINTTPLGLGEPLNAIISALSDPDVLKDQELNGGLRNYFLSFGYSSECLGQHLGDDQAANLGDGRGFVNETAVIRWNYGDPELGSCKESIEGGSHFRYWVQNGPAAHSGAIFMAVSYELSLAQYHEVTPNGYNLGRDWMIGNITNQAINSSTLTAGATFSGQSKFANYTYQTDVSYVPGLLANSSDGVNHYLSVGVNGANAIDGLVAVMNVKIVERPSSSHALRSLSRPSSWTLLSLATIFITPFVFAGFL